MPPATPPSPPAAAWRTHLPLIAMVAVTGAVIFYLWRELQKARRALMPVADAAVAPKLAQEEESEGEFENDEFEYHNSRSQSRPHSNSVQTPRHLHHHQQQQYQSHQQYQQYDEEDMENASGDDNDPVPPGKIDRSAPGKIDRSTPRHKSAPGDAPGHYSHAFASAATDADLEDLDDPARDDPARDNPDAAELKDVPPPTKAIRRRSTSSRV